jgi:hypothetical protein
MSAEIEHGWNGNHHSDDRLNMTRASEKKKKEKEKERDSSFSKKTNPLVM